jgi:hypothetical protein
LGGDIPKGATTWVSEAVSDDNGELFETDESILKLLEADGDVVKEPDILPQPAYDYPSSGY